LEHHIYYGKHCSVKPVDSEVEITVGSREVPRKKTCDKRFISNNNNNNN